MKICPKCNRRFKSSYDTCTPCRDKPIKDKDKKISVVKISKIIIIIFIAISLYYLYDTDSSKIINEHEINIGNNNSGNNESQTIAFEKKVEEVKVCPFNCNDNDVCTNDFCSNQTNYECVNEKIIECKITSSLEFEFNNAQKYITKIEKIWFEITNRYEKNIEKLKCDYEIFNGEGQRRKKSYLLIASNDRNKNIGPLLSGETKSYIIAPYSEMVDQGPHKVVFDCLNNTYEMFLEFGQTCKDGILNQDETNIDCGGICNPCVFDMNDELIIDDFSIKINDMLSLDRIGKIYDEDGEEKFQGKKADGIFYIIEMEITNIGNLEKTISPNEFEVYDNYDRSYKLDSEGLRTYNNYYQPHKFNNIESISPKETVRGYLVYDLITNVKNPVLIIFSKSDNEFKHISLN
ncbi:DUF4352 domain-containing protein [archaeon]|nr:DUF4352 domain-containing protein [archaeon]